MKAEALNHTKLKRLCRRLDIPEYQGGGILVFLWNLTAREAPAGDIGRLSNEDIAIGIDYRGDENKLVDALLSAGWLDEHPEHRLVIHDWWDHCEDRVHMKLARARKFFVDGQVPKLSRLPEYEKKQAHAFYDSCAQTADPCVPCARIDDSSARRERNPAPPRLEPVTNETSISVEQKSEPAIEDRPFVRPEPTSEIPELPRKPMLVSATTRGKPEVITPERIAGIRDLLHGYMSDGGRRQVKPPDEVILLRCLEAIGETPIARVADHLRQLFSCGQSPRHASGPNGYAWFPAVLAHQFSGADLTRVRHS